MSPAPSARHDARGQAEGLGRARKPLTEQLKREAEDDPSIFDAWQAAFDDAVADAHAKAGEPVRDSAADTARRHREQTAGAPRLAGPGAQGSSAGSGSALAHLRRDARRGTRAATATFEGSGSVLGVVVAMFALVLLYVLLTRSGAVSQLVGNISQWLARFLSPDYPLF